MGLSAPLYRAPRYLVPRYQATGGSLAFSQKHCLRPARGAGRGARARARAGFWVLSGAPIPVLRKFSIFSKFFLSLRSFDLAGPLIDRVRFELGRVVRRVARIDCKSRDPL